MKIYTKTGDLGQTSLFTGKRVSKSNELVCVYGMLDELNATLGLLKNSVSQESVDFQNELKTLSAFQRHLFNLGTYFASEGEKKEYISKIVSWTESLETQMDAMTSELPPLKNFILPGGATSACYAHRARVESRKVEREMVLLMEKEAVFDKDIISYMNRASDYFFTLARFLNFKVGVEETEWVKDV